MGERGKRLKRIGIFGGTFDPPHVGHQILAMEAFDELKLDEVHWVLAPNPPHKLGKRITPTNIRLKMVKAAIKNEKIFKLSRVDLDREGPHYVLDTVNIFRGQHPNHLLFFIMGGDSLHELPKWHASNAFVAACDGIGVMHRPGEKIDLSNLEHAIPGLTEKIHFIEAPLLEISSNKIRELVSVGKPYRYYLPRDVYRIVKKENLYLES